MLNQGHLHSTTVNPRRGEIRETSFAALALMVMRVGTVTRLTDGGRWRGRAAPPESPCGPCSSHAAMASQAAAGVCYRSIDEAFYESESASRADA